MSSQPGSDIDLADRSIYPVWATDTIRYSDLDPNNHVNNGAINSYLEDGRVRFRTEHLASVGADVLAGFVLVKYTIEYRSALHFPGSVEIGTAVVRIGTKSYTVGQAVFRDQLCIATAEVVTVRTDPTSGRSVALDESLRAALQTAAPRTV